MLLKKHCTITNKLESMEVNIKLPQLMEIDRRTRPIQEVAPYLTPAEREFIMTGITPEIWSSIFSKEEV